MNQLLPSALRYCASCDSWRQFRISRFGCVFACRCRNQYIDFIKVLRDFLDTIINGEKLVEYMPILSGRLVTDHFRVAQVELDLVKDHICLRIMNMTTKAVAQLLHGLPFSLGDWTVNSHDHFIFPKGSLDLLIHELRVLSDCKESRLYVNEPSSQVRSKAFSPMSSNSFHLEDLIPARLFVALQQHQIDGVCTALRYGGRILFADEMGVGKTLQAIGTIAALKTFPVLIVCPAALRHLWTDEVEKWLLDLVGLNDIHVITSSNMFMSAKDNPKVVITSYQMTTVLAHKLKEREWSCLVADESHLLHTTEGNSDAQYTSLVCDIGRRSKHCILLSGTPSLVSPFNLFNQIDTLRQGLLGENRYDFALRYCRLEFTPHLKVHECTRNVELHSLLSSTCMIRRLKSEILNDLPSKQRVIIRVPEVKALPRSKNVSFQEEYSTSWRRKIQGIFEIVDFALSKYTKIVLFAHHIRLIECLTSYMTKRNITFMRIDGSTPVASRKTMLLQFNYEDIRVAIVGITACAVGICLTGATCAFFCELPPDAAWMQQAEDRLHRPGQKNNVTIFYVLGADSFFDGNHFARICRSFEVTHQTTDGEVGAPPFLVSYTSHETPCVDGKYIVPESKRVTITSFQVSTFVPFFFRISSNTGRIHVAQMGKHLFSLSIDEVQAHWNLGSAFSRQLRDFSLRVELMSTVERRRLINAKVWLTSNSTWTPRIRKRDIFTRYTGKLPLFGRVFFWKVDRRNGFVHMYGALLIKRGSGYRPMCLDCTSILENRTYILPGNIVCTETDTDMFCSGSCRGAFYMKRSGSTIRRNVEEAEKGICSHCQVDCVLLCSLVAAATTRTDREAVIDRFHPQMRLHPRLFSRFVENPLPGNVWNADHVLPVNEGGGQATMENIQTLCVACHADKTMNEAKLRRNKVLKKIPSTTVNTSCSHFAIKASRRVTTARFPLIS